MKLMYEQHKEAVFSHILLDDLELRGTGKSFLKDIIANSTVINISNVRRYIEEHQLDDVGWWQPKLHPILAPQFKNMWMEFTVTDMERFMKRFDIYHTLKEFQEFQELTSNRFAILTESHNNDEFMARYGASKLANLIKDFHNYDLNAKWLLSLWVIFQSKQYRYPVISGIGIMLYVRADGSINNNIRLSSSLVYPKSLDVKPYSNEYKKLSEFIYTLCLPALMAISFMHCKNVTQVDYDPANASRSTRRRKPNICYKTLHINPMGSRQSARNSRTTDIKMPLHIARGHFKTFTTEAPLFGKYKGTYWWSPQVRGRKQHGEVIKDYEIDDPKD